MSVRYKPSPRPAPSEAASAPPAESRSGEPGALDGGLRGLFVIACVAVVVAGLKAASGVLVPFVLGIFIALLSLPGVMWLRSKGVSNWIAVLLITLVDASVVVGAVLLLIGSLSELANALPEYDQKLSELVGRLQLPETLRVWLNDRGIVTPRQLALALIADADITLLTQSVVGRAASLFTGTVFAVLVAVFALFEASTIAARLRAVLTGRDLMSRLDSVTLDVQRYLGLKTLTSAVAGVLVWLWAQVLGVDFALLLGLVMFLFHFVPNIGAFLAATPGCMIALVQLGPGVGLLMALGYLAIGVIIGNIIEPPLMGRQFGLSTLVVLVTLVFWGWVWGPVGMFLSVPLTMIVKIVLEHSRDFRNMALLLSDKVPGAG